MLGDGRVSSFHVPPLIVMLLSVNDMPSLTRKQSRLASTVVPGGNELSHEVMALLTSEPQAWSIEDGGRTEVGATASAQLTGRPTTSRMHTAAMAVRTCFKA